MVLALSHERKAAVVAGGIVALIGTEKRYRDDAERCKNFLCALENLQVNLLVPLQQALKPEIHLLAHGKDSIGIRAR